MQRRRTNCPCRGSVLTLISARRSAQFSSRFEMGCCSVSLRHLRVSPQRSQFSVRSGQSIRQTRCGFSGSAAEESADWSFATKSGRAFLKQLSQSEAAQLAAAQHPASEQEADDL